MTVLLGKVRVADIMGSRPPIEEPSILSTSVESLGVSLSNGSLTARVEEEGDQSGDNVELYESEDSDEKGVLYCELETENSVPISTEDGEKEKIDPSIQCMSTEGP